MKKLILIVSLTTYSLSLVHAQIISTVAGGPAANNVLATSIGMEIYGAVADKHGNLYVTDASNSVIRRVNLTTGIATIVAGAGNYAGDKGDGGPATDASIGPGEIALDTAGNLYFNDFGAGFTSYPPSSKIRKVNISTGIITTIAGIGTTGFSGNGGPATAAEINIQCGLAFDQQNNMYIADENNQKVRKVNAVTGIITTIAGTGLAGYSGDNGAATAARLSYPSSVCVDDSGSIYITDGMNNRVRKINWKTGVITTIAGNGSNGYSGDGGPATAAELSNPFSLNIDQAGNIYVADGITRLRKISISTSIITTVAGNGIRGFKGDGGPATSAEVNSLSSVSLDIAGNIYVGDGLDPAQGFSTRVRKVDGITNNISTVAGNGGADYNGDGMPATDAQLCGPNSIKIDAAGNIYIAEFSNYRIREINGAGMISTFCGTGSCGDKEDALAANAKIYGPSDLAFDKSGNMFIADYYNNRVSEIDLNDSLIPFAGNGFNEPLGGAYSGDGGPATAAELYYPNGVAADDSGNVFIADMLNSSVRKVSRKTGIITTLAGNGSGGYGGDGGNSTAAILNFPEGIAIDDSGNVYIADSFNHRIRKIAVSTGIITTVAGNGYTAPNYSGGFSGDGGPATAAELNYPSSITLDQNGYLYIADCLNQRVRVVDPLTHKIKTVAGNGTLGFRGDGGPATIADLNYPVNIAVDGWNLYIADFNNNRIRKVSNVLGLNTIAEPKSNVKVYPNPNNGAFTIEASGIEDNASVEIYNMLGELIYSAQLNRTETQIDLSKESTGVYLFRIHAETGGLISEGKIIKE